MFLPPFRAIPFHLVLSSFLHLARFGPLRLFPSQSRQSFYVPILTAQSTIPARPRPRNPRPRNPQYTAEGPGTRIGARQAQFQNQASLSREHSHRWLFIRNQGNAALPDPELLNECPAFILRTSETSSKPTLSARTHRSPLRSIIVSCLQHATVFMCLCLLVFALCMHVFHFTCARVFRCF